MTMATLVYNSAKTDIANGDIVFDADTFYALLVTDTYTPDRDSHNRRDDVTNEVANGNGYTTGGAALTSVTVTQDNTNDRVVIDAADLTWSSSTITARGCVIYKRRGGASSADELVCAITFGSDYASSAGNFTIQWPAAGFLTLS